VTMDGLKGKVIVPGDRRRRRRDDAGLIRH
jgi:hypothetical protein